MTATSISMNGKEANPMARVSQLAEPSAADIAMILSTDEPSTGAIPRRAGAWERAIWPDMPARNPVVTGIDRRSAIQPSRNSPLTMRIAPTRRARIAAKAAYSGAPLAASRARPPAKMGVIVESAPIDIARLAPKMAKPTAPAIIARKARDEAYDADDSTNSSGDRPSVRARRLAVA